MTPSEFWKLHPQEFWWLFEAMMPPKGETPHEEVQALKRLYREAKAKEAENG